MATKPTIYPNFKEPKGYKYVKLENDDAFYAVKERFGNQIIKFIKQNYNKVDSIRKAFIEILSHDDNSDLNEITKYKLFLTKYVKEDADLLRMTHFMYDNYNTWSVFPCRSPRSRYIFKQEIHKRHIDDDDDISFIEDYPIDRMN